MAKGRSGKSVSAEDKVARTVRKNLRKLEAELAAATRQERKRLRKLERARNRRQLIEAALDELRKAAPPAAVAPATTKPKPPAPTTTKPAASTPKPPAATKPAAKPAPAKPATKPAAAPKTTTPKPPRTLRTT